jgi:hypothetical protein
MTHLSFWREYRVTHLINDAVTYRFIGVAPRQDEVALPGGEVGVRVRIVVNNPERFEQQIVGRVLLDTDDAVEVERVSPDVASEDLYVVRFEPLTMQRWKEMAADIACFDELEREITTEDELHLYYRGGWCPSSWLENPPTNDPQPV